MADGDEETERVLVETHSWILKALGFTSTLSDLLSIIWPSITRPRLSTSRLLHRSTIHHRHKLFDINTAQDQGVTNLLENQQLLFIHVLCHRAEPHSVQLEF